MSSLPAVRGRLPELSQDELDALADEDRHAEAWYRYMTGHTQTDIARDMGVSRPTIKAWLRREAVRRRTRAQSVDDELERLVGTLEAVAIEAWKSHRSVKEGEDPASLAGPNYLRLVLDATKEIAKIRGLDVKEQAASGVTKKTEVVVRIGGSKDAPELALGVRTA